MPGEKTFYTRQQIKRDTTEHWASATNFAPLPGELIYYTDVNKIKVGDGSTVVSNLEFIDSDKANVLSTNTATYMALVGTDGQYLRSSASVSLWGPDITYPYYKFGTSSKLEVGNSSNGYLLINPSSNSGSSLKGLATPSSNYDAANKKYVDDGLSSKMNALSTNATQYLTIAGTEGGILRSDISFTEDTYTKTYSLPAYGGDSKFNIVSIGCKTNTYGHGALYIDSSGSNTVLKGLVTPTSNYDAVNKKYVDDNTAPLLGSSSTVNLSYVDSTDGSYKRAPKITYNTSTEQIQIDSSYEAAVITISPSSFANALSIYGCMDACQARFLTATVGWLQATYSLEASSVMPLSASQPLTFGGTATLKTVDVKTATDATYIKTATELGQQVVNKKYVDEQISTCLPSSATAASAVFANEISYTTTAPSASNTSGNIKFVVLSQDPVTKYDGYLYIIAPTSS